LTDWYQQHLTPPEVVEVRVRLGVVADADHCQALVELIDPVTGVQIAQWSNPHAPATRWYVVFDQAVDKAREYLATNCEPF
jgi:hypothetical protein